MNRWLTLFALTGLLFQVSCTDKTKHPGDACSFELSGIQFTRCLNDADRNTTRERDGLIIRSDARKDYFNDPDGKLSNNTAPVLLTEVNNTRPFTVTVKVTPQFSATYDAGAVYLYSSDERWQKFAFEKDEEDRTRIVSVRTIETSDDNNHDIITSSSLYLRISSDTRTMGFYYSENNTVWNLARLYKNDFPATIWLGLSTQSPLGDGTTAIFEGLSVTGESVSDFRSGI